MCQEDDTAESEPRIPDCEAPPRLKRSYLLPDPAEIRKEYALQQNPAQEQPGTKESSQRLEQE
nr:hypothetical protein [Nocardioides mangrovicus]